MIGGVIVMRRYEDLKSLGLGDLEKSLDVLDCLVFLDAVTD
jgi:hypothetical protein